MTNQNDITPITEQLYIGKTPNYSDWNIIYKKGIKLVLNMRLEKKVKTSKEFAGKITNIWIPTIDFVLFSMPISQLEKGVNAALPILQSGAGVYIFCKESRHRSAAMMAAILISQGMTDQEAMKLISLKHPSVDFGNKQVQRAISRYYEYRTLKVNKL